MKFPSKETKKKASTVKPAQSEAVEPSPREAAEPDSFATKLGARMRDLRLEKNLSLADLRRAGGLTPSQMSVAERGLAAVSMTTLFAVARAVGVPPFIVLALPDRDAFAAVLEEIRQAYEGDLSQVLPVLEENLGVSPERLLAAARRARHKKR